MSRTSWFASLARGGQPGSNTRASSPYRIRERGATAVEYCIMVSLIMLVIVLAVTTLGLKVAALFVLPSGAL